MPLPTLVPIIMMFLSAAATAYSTYEQYQAGKEAEEIANRNAQRTREETAEMVRRAEKRSKRMEGLSKARAFASGLTGESHELYLSDMERSNAEEVEWIIRSGASKAEIEARAGSLARRQATIGMITSGIQGIGSTVNWWSQYSPAPTNNIMDYAPGPY